MFKCRPSHLAARGSLAVQVKRFPDGLLEIWAGPCFRGGSAEIFGGSQTPVMTSGACHGWPVKSRRR